MDRPSRLTKRRYSLKAYLLFIILFLALILNGCQDWGTPMPEDILKNPLGTETIKIGMTKAQVKNYWGDPDEINIKEDEKMWGGSRTEWVYKGRYTSLPVSAGYLSKTKKLYFDGENLTNIVTE